MPIPLSRAALDKLPASIGRPNYRREDLSPGIVHFGVGNFHRAHQAVYVDRLMNQGVGCDWAICGVGTRPADQAVVGALRSQDYLSLVVEESAAASSARVTGPMIDMIGPGHEQDVIAALADPRIRVVTMTITEGGYYTDPATGRFDVTHSDIVADAHELATPNTVFGLILAGLERRWAEGAPAFTVASCDNITGNGDVARAAVVGLARLRNPGLARKVEDSVAFPNAMVDRITPATSDIERERAAQLFGVKDNWPIFCEDYLEWVVEDDFPQGRPPLEDVGVRFVGDVTAYETMKLRILNGGHAVMAYPAALLDITYAHEAMAHPLVSHFLEKVIAEDVLPQMTAAPGTDLTNYAALTRRRFSNPNVADTIIRLCFDGSNRQPKFILPSLADGLAAGQKMKGLALVCALWCKYCAGRSETGARIAANDPNWSRLQETAQAAKTNPVRWLEQRWLYGDLADHRDFALIFSAALEDVWTKGVAPTLSAYLGAAADGVGST
ncbi:MAG: mannitol dehydrogenase family protein [Pseudomonadota bacterium]